MWGRYNAAGDPVIGDPRLWAVEKGEHLAKGLRALLDWSWVSLVHGTHSRGHSLQREKGLKRVVSPESFVL